MMHLHIAAPPCVFVVPGRLDMLLKHNLNFDGVSFAKPTVNYH